MEKNFSFKSFFSSVLSFLLNMGRNSGGVEPQKSYSNLGKVLDFFGKILYLTLEDGDKKRTANFDNRL